MGNYLLVLLRRSWRALLLASLLGGGAAACTTAVVALINQLVARQDGVLVPRFIALAGVGALLAVASQTVLVRRGAALAYEMRRSLAAQVLRQPLRELEAIGPAPLFSALTQHVTSVVQVFWALGLVVPALLTALSLLVYIGTLSWALLLWTVLTLLVLIFADRGHRARSEKYHTALTRVTDPMVDSLRILTGGAKELKLNRQRADLLFKSVLEPSFDDVRKCEVAVRSLDAFAAPMQQLGTMLGLAVVLAYGAKFGISASALAAYAVTILALGGQLGTVVLIGISVVQGSAAIAHVERLGISLTAVPEELETSTQLPPPAEKWNLIALNEMRHTYRGEREDSRFVLGPIDLAIRQGEITFIVGGNGSGKSTLAKVLTGLYPPEGGELWFAGKLIDRTNLEWYRNHFSAIFSDFMLFDTLDGLGVGNVDVQAAAYLRLLQLDHKVKVQKGRLSSTTLSQGQRKRLALLASYLEDRSIYVFDEWAADQDPSFKAVFYTRLLPDLKKRGKTVIVISHDDAYFKVADQLIKLENGQINNDSTGQFMSRLARSFPDEAEAAES